MGKTVKNLISFVEVIPSKENGTHKRLFEASFIETDPGDNAVYAMGDIIISTTEGMCRVRDQFSKYVFGPENSVTVLDIRRVDSIPLEVLRALSAQRKPWGNPISSIELFERTIGLTISFPLRSAQEAPQFHFLDRSTSGELSWKLSSYDYHGSAPLFRVLPNIIYVEEEKCFYLFGGYFPTDLSPESQWKFWLKKTEESLRPKASSSSHKKRKKAESLYEERLKILKNSFLSLPDLWKYDIDKNSWERFHLCGGEGTVVSRGSQSLEVNWERVHFVAGGMLHVSRKKIYYILDILVSKWSKSVLPTYLIEYDYQTNKTTYCGIFDYVTDTGPKFPVIDYSNNTLIIFAHESKGVYFVVMCFETYKHMKVTVKDWNAKRLRKKYGVVDYWTLKLIDSFKTLVLLPSYSTLEDETKNENTAIGYIDWPAIRSEKIDSFLTEIRSEFSATSKPTQCECNKEHKFPIPQINVPEKTGIMDEKVLKYY